MGSGQNNLLIFAGRSNVGKSTLFSKLFKVSVKKGKKPGTTIKPNFYRAGDVTAVDLPGYGYMKGISYEFSEKVKDFIVHYIENNAENIILAVQVIDIHSFREIVNRWESRGEIPIDIEMCEFLKEVCRNVIVAANKIDKVNKKTEEIEFAKKKLKAEIIPISAKKGDISYLKNRISEICKKEGVSIKFK